MYQRLGKFGVSGGADFAEATTGYVAANCKLGYNTLTATANKLGTENKNVILSYNRSNIPVGKITSSLTAATYANENQQGLHLVNGWHWNKLSLFASVGIKHTMNAFAPNAGVGFKFNL